MSDGSYNPSNETHHSPCHMPSVPSTPKPPYSPTLAEAGLHIVQLKQLNEQHNADNQQLRARLGLLSIPDGFEHNEGRVAARVPSRGRGQMVVPTWIRPVGDGTVELLAGREPGEPTYIIELFLRPNYTENHSETAAP